MKKVLSFVLAVVMVLSLSTVAFAWKEADISVDPDTDEKAIIAVDKDSAEVEDVTVDNIVLPMTGKDGEGAEFVIGVSTGSGTAKDFKISAVVKKGADVVTAKVDADGKKVTIKAIPDWSWSLTKSEKFEVIVRVVPATKDYKTAGDVEIKYAGIVVLAGDNSDKLINNETGVSATDLSVLETGETKREDLEREVASGNVYKVKEKVDGLTLTFAGLDKISMEFGKVYDTGSTLIVYNTKAVKSVVKANLDAELSFYNFLSKPEFDVAGKVIIEADEDEFIYEIVDGKPVASKFAWDEDEFAWVLKTNVLGCYVVSDKELEVAADAPVANPSTGASDMVNVAVAMAVVSIAAAGAVALKK